MDVEAMNKQTIDGVPRELLERAVQAIINTSQMHPALEDLRALLDEPAEPVAPCAIADALESAQWPSISIGNKVLVAAAITELRKAAQPQGEPVAHTMKTVMQAYENAQALHLPGTSNFCAVMAKHLNKYAEQPAPVAGKVGRVLINGCGEKAIEFDDADWDALPVGAVIYSGGLAK